MVFTTQIFLYVFFPVCMLAYLFMGILEAHHFTGKLFARFRGRDFTIIVFGLGFYGWACFPDLARFLVYIGAVYLLARWIERARPDDRCATTISAISGDVRRLSFYIAAAVVIFVLVYYNYTGILAKIWNWAFKDHIEVKSLVAPLGLSFITFSSVSYLADIYHGKATAGSLVDCALYLTFFPKVVSGPVVLWKEFQPQIRGGAENHAGFWRFRAQPHHGRVCEKINSGRQFWRVYCAGWFIGN